MQLTSPLVLIFSTLFLGTIAAPSGSSSGILIPNNLPNGGYYVTVSSSGKYSAPIALSPLEKKSFPNPLDLESRQLPDPEIGCSGYNINDGDFASARYSLNAWWYVSPFPPFPFPLISSILHVIVRRNEKKKLTNNPPQRRRQRLLLWSHILGVQHSRSLHLQLRRTTTLLQRRVRRYE